MAIRSPALQDARTNPCAITRSLSFLSDPWSFLILRNAFFGSTRFADFRDALGIAPDVLSARLAQLVEVGVLDKVPYTEPGQRTRDAYELTAAGQELKVVLASLQQWGDEHLPSHEKPTVVRVEHGTGRPLHVAFVDDDARVVPDADAEFLRTETFPTRLTSP